MSLKTLQLKKTYSSDLNNILHDFYIPVLEESTEYNRLTGFFSSASLATAAKGILGFIKNNGVMKLIASPRLNQSDINIILDAHEHPEKFIEMKMLEELENSDSDNTFIKDHILALGWMIANKRLEIKIAIPHNDKGIPLTYERIEESGIFHQKVGILQDLEGNIVTFSGSINETESGWLGNIEEFKVFKSWVSSEEEYVKADILKFDRFWEGKSQGVMTIDIPYAVKNKLIEIAPDDINQVNLKKWYKDIGKKKKIILFQYQKDAVNAWVKNNKMGIFEMATGTGKTFAALGCLKRVSEHKKKLVIVIACPYSHLVKQWLAAIREFGIFYEVIIADSSNHSWKNKLTDAILDIKNGISDKLIVLTTHATFSTNDFIRIISGVKGELFLIVDEVHGVGAPKRREGLIEDYHFRLGLSATPKRWFDLSGTTKIFNYFGGTVFEFPLQKAINTINPATGRTFLVPYEYKPYFVGLTEKELSEYEKETKKISKAYYHAKDKKEKDKWFSLLLIKRQKIIKNAIDKFAAFEKILDNIGEIKDCLVYCSPQQIDRVQDILNSYKGGGVIQHKFTNEEGIVPEDKYGGISEREFLLQGLAQGKYNVLVAMKCLDEGVDVPSAKTAIILASTGNPRQYIQRRGRILRRFPGKEKAIIYDVIVVPALYFSARLESLKLEQKILGKELKRYKEFADTSINAIECLKSIEKLEEMYEI